MQGKSCSGAGITLKQHRVRRCTIGTVHMYSELKSNYGVCKMKQVTCSESWILCIRKTNYSVERRKLSTEPRKGRLRFLACEFSLFVSAGVLFPFWIGSDNSGDHPARLVSSDKIRIGKLPRRRVRVTLKYHGYPRYPTGLGCPAIGSFQSK